MEQTGSDVFQACVHMDRSVIEAFERRFVSIDTGGEVNLDNPVGTLQALLERLTQSIAMVDLTAITEKPSWWKQFTGAHLQSQIELETETETVSRLFEKAHDAAEDVRVRRQQYDDRREKLIIALPKLSALDAWAMTQLSLPEADRSADSAWYRDRLETRQANLKTIMISAKLHLSQMELVRRHIDFILDVHFELEQKLYPVWKQHVENLASSSPDTKETEATARDMSTLGRRLGERMNSITTKVGTSHE